MKCPYCKADLIPFGLGAETAIKCSDCGVMWVEDRREESQ